MSGFRHIHSTPVNGLMVSISASSFYHNCRQMAPIQGTECAYSLLPSPFLVLLPVEALHRALGHRPIGSLSLKLLVQRDTPLNKCRKYAPDDRQSSFPSSNDHKLLRPGSLPAAFPETRLRRSRPLPDNPQHTAGSCHKNAAAPAVHR